MTKNISKRLLRRRGNTHLLQGLSYQGGYNIHTEIELIKYNTKHVLSKKILPEEKLADEISSHSVSWFRVVGFTDIDRISKICNNFGIQRFDIKDMFSGFHVTKAVTYRKATFIMLSSCNQNKNGITELGQIAFILGQGYVISFEERESSVFDNIKTAIDESHFQLREKGADYLLYILLNCVHTGYNDVIDKIAVKLDDMEEKLVNREDEDDNVMRFIRNHKSEYLAIRRSVVALREEYINIFHNTNKLIEDENIVYFNDFDDRLRTTMEELDIMHEALGSLMDLYFNNNNLKMNEIMKRLTVVSTIFIPLTFMVGVWGMNFKSMPELDWEYGYFVSWGILITMAVLAFIYLKKKKWF